MRAAVLPMIVLASMCGGCDPVTMGVGAGASLAANSLLGESKMKQEARQAYAGAPDCIEVTAGIPNGHVVMHLRDIGWYRYYPMPDGRNVEAEPDKSLVVVEYDITNSTDRVVLVNPARALLSDADGKVTPEKAGLGGPEIANSSPDSDGRLGRSDTWQMLSVFEVAPSAYALLVPNGRMTQEPNPHRLAACRLPRPTGDQRSRL